jgi:hypothetical protein
MCTYLKNKTKNLLEVKMPEARLLLIDDRTREYRNTTRSGNNL